MRTTEILKMHHDVDEMYPENDTRWEPHYTKVLNAGHIGLIDFMGSDSTIVNAARVSYAGGTKATRSDEGLIRYLMRNKHTTPFEMCEFLFHVKAPIFVFRQWHRHRTASINEMSARYSMLDNEMFVPHHTHTAPQARDNKQGRQDNLLDTEDYNAIRTALDHAYETSYQTYLYLAGPQGDEGTQAAPPDAIHERRLMIEQGALNTVAKLRQEQLDKPEDERIIYTESEVEVIVNDWFMANGIHVITKDYPGIARELARMVLPVATYSQMYWKANLKNIMNFMALRSDAHAQYEIRVYSDAMAELIRPYVPMAMKAFDDYWLNGVSFSRMEVELLRAARLGNLDITKNDVVENFLLNAGCSKREIAEFFKRF